MSFLALIVAVAANDVIGRDNRLPWHLPEDLRYFKRMTLGKPVLMGRKTWESIGHPLPGRPNLVVSTRPGWTAPGALVAPSLTEALRLAEPLAGDGEIMVIGGARLFTEALPLARRLYLTEVHGHFDGDVFFPPPDPAQWREIRREDHPTHSFTLLERCDVSSGTIQTA
jgi:dihydrofolate reductase